jgi:hypothetical protein
LFEAEGVAEAQFGFSAAVHLFFDVTISGVFTLPIRYSPHGTLGAAGLGS